LEGQDLSLGERQVPSSGRSRRSRSRR
jgi:hypothetical protein